MPDFDPDKFLASTEPQGTTTGFDPDKFLAQTSPPAALMSPKPPSPIEEKNDLIPSVSRGVQGTIDLAKSAGSGLYNAVTHPLDTLQQIRNTPKPDLEGTFRAIRATPGIGEPINDIIASGHALAALPQGIEAAQAAEKSYRDNQQQEDAAHAKEHPLTDFIQRSAGLVAIPGDAVQQVGMLAMDAFNRSMREQLQNIPPDQINPQKYSDAVGNAVKDARNTAVFVGGSLGVAKAASAIPGKLGGYAAREAGVTDEAISRYRENPDAVNAAQHLAKDPEALKNMIDAEVAPVNQAVDTAQEGVANAKQAVADTKLPPQDLASEIPAHLDTQGAKLKDISGQAFDILENEGHSFPAQDLSSAIQNQMDSLNIGGVTPSIGPDAAAYGSLGKFKDMVDEIGQKTPGGQLPAPIVKQLIQQLDGVSKDAYTTNAGALSPAAAQNLAAVRRTFDQVLKQASPAYEAKMAELSPQVQLVNDMSKMFGNEQTAMTALKAAADPMTPKGLVVRQKLGEYDAQNGTDFLPRVTDFYDKPKQNLADAQQTLQGAQDRASTVNRLGPGSTEAAIPRIQNDHNFEARKQLEALNPELAQTVQDAGISRQFMKSTTNGSRKAKIGAGVGGAIGAALGGIANGAEGAVIGGHIGGAIGGGLGGLADIYGGQAVKAALDAGIKIDRITDTPYIKPLMQAAQESPKALAVTHYMLSQTDPGYQKLINDNH